MRKDGVVGFVGVKVDNILIVMFAYTHPLINDGGSRRKSDPENERRIQLVLRRYEEWYLHKHNKPLGYSVDAERVRRAKILYPLSGGAIGLISNMAFVHAKSKYIGKFNILFCVLAGLKMAGREEQCYNLLRYYENFHLFPADIQKMVDNNDAKYAYKWLRDDYMNN